jgi:hypothetical protein
MQAHSNSEWNLIKWNKYKKWALLEGSWTWKDGFLFNKFKELRTLSNPLDVDALKVNPFELVSLPKWSSPPIRLDGTPAPCELLCSMLEGWISLDVPACDIWVNTLQRNWQCKTAEIAQSAKITNWERNYFSLNWCGSFN